MKVPAKEHIEFGAVLRTDVVSKASISDLAPRDINARPGRPRSAVMDPDLPSPLFALRGRADGSSARIVTVSNTACIPSIDCLPQRLLHQSQTAPDERRDLNAKMRYDCAVKRVQMPPTRYPIVLGLAVLGGCRALAGLTSFAADFTSSSLFLWTLCASHIGETCSSQSVPTPFNSS